MKFYLKGAYGPGNLGDDVLLVACVNILRELDPKAEIYVGVERPDVGKSLISDVRWVDRKKPVSVDLFAYGGGGQFFSFDNSGQSADVVDKGIIHKLFFFLKNNRNLIWAAKRIIYSLLGAHENLVRSKFVASMFIGMGPFEVDGKGYDRADKFLKAVDFFSVRDEKSLVAASTINPRFNGSPCVYSDPTFCRSIWFDDDLDYSYCDAGYYSFVVRDWPFTEEGRSKIDLMVETADAFRKEGKKVRLVSLDKNFDRNLIERLSCFEWLIYDPELGGGLKAFFNEFISESTCIVSARAHGVWLPAVLGCPTVVMPIENKLYQVHASLPRSSFLSMAKTRAELVCEIDSFLSDIDNRKSFLEAEISSNRAKVVKGISDFKGWYNENV